MVNEAWILGSENLPTGASFEDVNVLDVARGLASFFHWAVIMRCSDPTG